ncbi:MAG: AarF/ABC1/UbiB kinase family protein [Deltaproteobacteria bacterium]|nr:AarF/ABC1/UbiB kinase family protein [Deltaproteobacteria bacterium]MDQ3299314.1 AarF/UbiB family protein [Myxococcota bacterium]
MTQSTSQSLAELRAAFGELVAPLRETAIEAGRLVQHLGARLDTLSLDIARDVGAVSRDAQAFAGAARDQATTLVRATPRAAKLAQVGAGLLARHRWMRLVTAARGDLALRDVDHRELARRTTAAAAQLRGGIAKLGQLASCRPDLVGPIWASELAALQDGVPAVDAAAIRARIEHELGRPLDAVFATFDDTPLAAASLAQVHAATLLDGTPVAVKVQVPGIEDVIEADIAALRTIAGALGDVPGIDLATLADELARALATELDYAAEAAALERFARAGSAVTSPLPIAHASSARVLTMTRIDGERLITALDAMPAELRDRVLGELVAEVAAQVLVRGQVHADPHPGNFLVTPDGKLALLDFGCTLELAPAERAAYARLVLAIAGANHDAAARELASLGFVCDAPAQLVAVTASLVGAMRPGTAVSELDWEAAFAEQIAQARQLGGLVIPRSFVLLGRVLATVAGLLAKYRPQIHIYPLIARHLGDAIG